MHSILRTILAVTVIAFALPVQAVQLDAEGCLALAQYVATAARIRDLGADESKHLAAAAKTNAEQAPEIRALVETLIKGVYASKASPEKLGEATLQMCIDKDGKIGEGV